MPALTVPRSTRPRAYLPKKLSYCNEVISMRNGPSMSTRGAGIWLMIAWKIGVKSAGADGSAGISVHALPSRPMA